MPISNLDDLPSNGPLLGIDPGSKYIGIAVSDPSRTIASPLATLVRGKTLAPLLERLLQLFDERKCSGLVLGLPVNMDGTEGPRAQSARALARNILLRRDVPIAFRDERLSTSAVDRAMIDAGTSRRRRAEQVDRLAAAWVLQGALDYLKIRP
jgi:putative Holliday junction resolvase